MKAQQREELLRALQERFESNMSRHKGVHWEAVRAKLESNCAKLRALARMEGTGGEPDVVGRDERTGEYVFYDCSAESPAGRRSTCYDREALESRKEHKPKDNAVDMAVAMGIEILTPEQYRELQRLGDFDLKTSSYRDLGHDDADARQLKALLAAAIIKRVDHDHLTVREAHARTGIAAADFSRIRNADLARFTLDRLMNILNRLGARVEVKVRIRAAPRAADDVAHA